MQVHENEVDQNVSLSIEDKSILSFPHTIYVQITTNIIKAQSFSPAIITFRT